MTTDEAKKGSDSACKVYEKIYEGELPKYLQELMGKDYSSMTLPERNILAGSEYLSVRREIYRTSHSTSPRH